MSGRSYGKDYESKLPVVVAFSLFVLSCYHKKMEEGVVLIHSLLHITTINNDLPDVDFTIFRAA
jgi:hypothetical protein